MKKILYLSLLAAFVSCTALKNAVRVGNVSNQQQVFYDNDSLEKAYKTYTLKIPKNWYSYKEVHGLIMHSPKLMSDRGEDYYVNSFYVLEYSTKYCKATNIESLFEFYHKKYKKISPKINFTPKKFIHKKYGEYYLIKFANSWVNLLFTEINILFHYKNRNFILSYRSENKYYEEFIKDVEGIISSFTIKEPI